MADLVTGFRIRRFTFSGLPGFEACYKITDDCQIIFSHKFQKEKQNIFEALQNDKNLEMMALKRDLRCCSE